MDPITISMLEMGLSLTGMVFKLLRQTPVGSGTQLQPHAMPEVREFVQESARRMETTIHAAVRQILDKLEQDQFELLLSRTRNLADLVALNRPDQALHYSMTLRESVDYALNRYRENKPHWLGAYLAGHSVFLAALRFADATAPDEVKRFNRFVLGVKTDLLDRAVPRLLARGQKVPWTEVAKFVGGQETDVVPRLLGCLAEPTAPTLVSRTNRPAELPRGDHRNPVIDRVTEILRDSALNGLLLTPTIPAQKLANATAAAKVPADDPVIGLIDCTVFGSASDCIVFAGRGLYYHHSSNSNYPPNPGYLAYHEFPACEFTKSGFFSISLGGDRYLSSSGSNVGRQDIIRILNEIKRVVATSR